MKALMLLICLVFSPLTDGHTYGEIDECTQVAITTPLVIPAYVLQVSREAKTDDRVKRLEATAANLESRVKSLELIVDKLNESKELEL